MQRFGSALNLNVHFHCVIPDGVWVRAEGTVRFVALPAPTDDDVGHVLLRIERRVRALLAPRLEAAKENAVPPDELAASQAEPVGAPRGKPPDASQAKWLAAYHQGFSPAAPVFSCTRTIGRASRTSAATAHVRRSRRRGSLCSPAASSPLA